MRLFIAAELPNALVEALAETTALLRENVRGRFVAPDMLHVTLAFLGDVEMGRLPDATNALARAALTNDRFQTHLGGLGYFGRPRNCTLWQGFARTSGDSDPWAHLARDVRSELAAEGLGFDEKSFLPHVTLMRGANIENVRMLPMPVTADGTISRIAVFKSDLSGPHPVYEEIESAALGEGSR